MDQIEIVPYRPEWAEAFASVAAELASALGSLALDIQHIGSTAVPGLAAKDIIDVQVTVSALDEDRLRPSVEAIGLVWRADIRQDHAPPGRDLPPAELAKLYAQRPSPGRVNCHFRAAGSFNERYAMVFRDYLRAHPQAAAAYGAVKRALAAHAPTDVELYYDVKDPVCDIIFEAAAAWRGEM